MGRPRHPQICLHISRAHTQGPSWADEKQAPKSSLPQWVSVSRGMMNYEKYLEMTKMYSRLLPKQLWWALLS